MTTCNSDTLQEFTGRIQGCDHEEYNKVGGLDLATHEIWYSESLSYNVVRNFVDQQTDHEIGNYTGIPYYTFTYPRFHEEAVFDTARNLTVGMGSCFEGIYLEKNRKSINSFIEQHTDKFFNTKPVSNIGVVFSRNTRDFYKDDIYTRSGSEPHCDEFGGWCENLIKMNLPYRVLIDSFIETEDLSGFDLIILPNCACMSSKMVLKLSRFVKNGGTLLATHETSLYDHAGNKLTDFQLSKLFGCSYLSTYSGINLPIVANHSVKHGDVYGLNSDFVTNNYEPALRDKLFSGINIKRLPNNRASVLVSPQKVTQVLAHSPAVFRLKTGFASLTASTFGKGKAIYFTFLPGMLTNTFGVHSSSMYGEDLHQVIDERIPEYSDLIKNTVQHALGSHMFVSLDKPVDGLLVHFKKDVSGNRYFVHLLATPERVVDENGLADKKYFPESQFDINAGTGEPFGNPLKNEKAWLPRIEYATVPQLKLNISKKIKFNSATMVSFDFLGEKKLALQSHDDHTSVILPRGSVTRYSVITLE